MYGYYERQEKVGTILGTRNCTMENMDGIGEIWIWFCAQKLNFYLIDLV